MYIRDEWEQSVQEQAKVPRDTPKQGPISFGPVRCLLIYPNDAPFDMSQAVPISAGLLPMIMARLPNGIDQIRSKTVVEILLTVTINHVANHVPFNLRINPLFHNGEVHAYTLSLPRDKLITISKLYPINQPEE